MAFQIVWEIMQVLNLDKWFCLKELMSLSIWLHAARCGFRFWTGVFLHSIVLIMPITLKCLQVHTYIHIWNDLGFNDSSESRHYHGNISLMSALRVLASWCGTWTYNLVDQFVVWLMWFFDWQNRQGRLDNFLLLVFCMFLSLVSLL